MTENTPDRREQIHQQIAALEKEVETLPPPATTVDRLLDLNHERANAPNALRPHRRTP